MYNTYRKIMPRFGRVQLYVSFELPDFKHIREFKPRYDLQIGKKNKLYVANPFLRSWNIHFRIEYNAWWSYGCRKKVDMVPKWSTRAPNIRTQAVAEKIASKKCEFCYHSLIHIKIASLIIRPKSDKTNKLWIELMTDWF